MSTGTFVKNLFGDSR